MKEKEFSNGQRLKALLISFQLGITFEYALKYLGPKDSTGEWDSLALSLQRSFVNQQWAGSNAEPTKL